MSQRVIPGLRILDEAAAKRFYRDGLGFVIEWEHRFEPGFPLFMQVRHGELTLYLTEHAGDCQPGGLVYLYVPDVDAWHQRASAAGLPCDGPPTDQPWGNRDFRLTDPFGNSIVVATRLHESAGGQPA